MKYVAIWFAAFVGISAIDALWHLGIFGRVYGRDFRPIARMKNGKLSLQRLPGIASQILVVSALMVLAILSVRGGHGYPANFLVGAMGGVLAAGRWAGESPYLSWGWNHALGPTTRRGRACMVDRDRGGPNRRCVSNIQHGTQVP